MSSESWKIQEEVEEAGPEKVLKEIKAKYFPNVAKDINLQIPAAEYALQKINPKKSIPKHITNFWKQITMKKISKAAFKG